MNWQRWNSSAIRASTVPSSNWRGRSTYLTRMAGISASIEAAHRIDHVGDLIVGQMLMNGERDDPSRLPLGHREVAVLVAEAAARGLEVERDRVMDLRLDAPAHEVGEEPIAIVRLEHVEVKDVPLPGIAGGNPHAAREVGEADVERAGVSDAGGRDRLDVLDQVIAHDGLQRVEPAVVAEDLDFVAVPEPVVAQEAELAVERVRARHDDAAVAPHVEVLEGVQAEARGHAEGAHEAVPDRGADGLAGVLHHG